MNDRQRDEIVEKVLVADKWPCPWCGELIEHSYDCRCQGSRHGRVRPGWMHAMVSHALTLAIPPDHVVVRVEDLREVMARTADHVLGRCPGKALPEAVGTRLGKAIEGEVTK